jgi:hypothetical protein
MLTKEHLYQHKARVLFNSLTLAPGKAICTLNFSWSN